MLDILSSPQATLESLVKKRCDDIASIREAHVSKTSTWAVNQRIKSDDTLRWELSVADCPVVVFAENSGVGKR